MSIRRMVCTAALTLATIASSQAVAGAAKLTSATPGLT
jgi:hypothetical protein